MGKVLIVDDDDTTIEAFSRMLRLEGYDVSTATSVEAAWREVDRSRPDVILLDLRMPHADGLVFLRRLRAHADRRDTPVAFITGVLALDDAITAEMRALEADLYFKPVWLEELVSITERLLQRAG